MKPSIARSSWHHAVASLERAATSSGSLRSCRFLPHTILDGGVVVGMQVGEKTFLAEAPTLWQALREAQEKDRHLAFPVVIQAIRRQRFHDRKFLLQAVCSGRGSWRIGRPVCSRGPVIFGARFRGVFS